MPCELPSSVRPRMSKINKTIYGAMAVIQTALKELGLLKMLYVFFKYDMFFKPFQRF